MSDADAVAAAECSSPRILLAAARFEWERVVRAADLPTSVKCIALILATYASKDGENVRPSVATVADHMRTSERTVNRAMVTLREAGLIERVRRGNRWADSSAHRTDLHRLTIPEGVLFMPELIERSTPEHASPGDIRVV
ncbi:helix-turn-helix domain-containing protein [Williamsia herbipolensis]|uniref:Helix-turn-helix domain-containing protein n=1 Tax=Williamsia herbipolensis TaxID=1603258 RepID=A0AAU4JY86_9NOCA|nr:helix-turn-helix domain-containing protein [Williamsia herbipolensis]